MSSGSLPEVTRESSGQVASKESMCFCHAPMGWLAVETAENMAALNVDYSACWGSFNGVSYYFLWKLKTSKRLGKHTVFQFKTKPIP